MLRVVVDTNVIISGILSVKGAPFELLNAWRERRFILLSSQAIVDEIRQVLTYPRIRKKYNLRDEGIAQVITLLQLDALLVSGSMHVAGAIPADPEDEKFLACAIEAQADVIVSGDHHLLDLGVYQDIPIMTARQFVDQLELL